MNAPSVSVATPLQEQFEDFHRLNPSVYDQLHDMTCTLLRKGHTRVGIGMLFEVLRWEWYLSTDDPHSEFKLNNNYRSRYARMLDAEFPGVFVLRELKS